MHIINELAGARPHSLLQVRSNSVALSGAAMRVILGEFPAGDDGGEAEAVVLPMCARLRSCEAESQAVRAQETFW